MATTIITKYGSGAPTASDVVRGELAVDTTNGRLYTLDGSSVIEIGLNPSGNVDVTGTVTADGLTVDGNATISVSDNSDNLTLVSTDTDANAGPNLLFKRDNNSAAGDDLMGSIVFQGEDAGNNLTDYVAFKTQIQDPTGGSEDGRLKIELMSGGTSRSLLDASGSNAIVFNEDGQALNFRVESSGDANMLFVDGTNNRVGIGTSSPASPLHVNVGTNLNFEVENSSSTLRLSALNDARSANIAMQFASSSFQFITGNVGIGTSSPDQTLHVHKGSAGTVSSHASSVLTLENSTTGILQFLTPNTAAQQIRFGDPQDNGAGIIQYDHSTNVLQFNVNGPERMRIDSSGKVGIGLGGASPSSELHVKGADETQVYIEAPAGSNAGIRLLENGTSKWTIGNDQSNDGLFFYDFTAAAERFRIDSSGVLILGAPGGNSTGIIQGSSGAGGTNQPGTDLQLKGGSGGGTGGSKVRFFTAPGGSSGTAESAAVERMYIAEDGVVHFNGDVKVLSGDIQMGSGRGINFSASSNASGMTSETLDDYEEGTWTPSLSASSTNPTPTAVTVNYASYTKIGNTVFIRAYITVNLTSIGSGGAEIQGLPFTVKASAFSPVFFTHGSLIHSSGGYFVQNTTRIAAIANNDTASIAFAGTGNRYLMISGQYEV